MELIFQYAMYYVCIMLAIVSGFFLKKLAKEEIKKYKLNIVFFMSVLFVLLFLFFIFDIRFTWYVGFLLMVGLIAGVFYQEYLFSLGVLFYLSLIFPSLLMIVIIFLIVMIYNSLYDLRYSIILLFIPSLLYFVPEFYYEPIGSFFMGLLMTSMFILNRKLLMKNKR